MEDLKSILLNTQSILSQEFNQSNKRLFEEEHLIKLSTRLIQFYNKQFSFELPAPFFEEEITPSLYTAFQFFEEALDVYFKIQSKHESSNLFANSLDKAGIENILLILGQRITPGSIRDSRAIPPIKKTLLDSASLIHKGKLISAAREWTKHTNRSKDKFWGDITGDDDLKNKISMDFINQILENATWWNVFWHYKHEIVFEARLSSGHGVRWGKDGTEFIGFLEPFMTS